MKALEILAGSLIGLASVLILMLGMLLALGSMSRYMKARNM